MSRWLVVALLTVSGCAFALDGPDPNRPRNKLPSCDTSKGAVALDGVVATALGVATLSVAANDGGAAALIPLSIGALYLGGALAGNSAVNECRKAQAEYEQSYGSESGERLAGAPDEDSEDNEQPQMPKRPRVKYDDSRGDVYASRRPPADAPVHPAPVTSLAPEPAAPVATAPAPAPASPTPAAPAGKPAGAPKAPPPAAKDEDEWSDFWREVE